MVGFPVNDERSSWRYASYRHESDGSQQESSHRRRQLLREVVRLVFDEEDVQGFR